MRGLTRLALMRVKARRPVSVPRRSPESSGLRRGRQETIKKRIVELAYLNTKNASFEVFFCLVNYQPMITYEKLDNQKWLIYAKIS